VQHFLAILCHFNRIARGHKFTPQKIPHVPVAICNQYFWRFTHWHFPLMLGGGLVGLVIGALLVIKGVRVCLGVLGLAETLVGVTLLAIAANSVELVEPSSRPSRAIPRW